MIPQFILAWLPAANIENPDVRNIVSNRKEKTMQQNRSEDDAQNQSYNEFKKNAERKVREENLKAIEDEAKRSLFPVEDNKLTPINELWKKGMEKKADRERIQEEVDSLSEDDRYDVTIYFDNLTPETVGWIMEKMTSYIHNARSINIEPVKEPQKGWRHALEAYDEPNVVFED